MVGLKIWIGRALLTFVLVTIGFALGRQTAPVVSFPPEPAAARGSTSSAARLVVYSTHMTFRCWECNQIEFLARELLENEFSAQMASGRVEFKSVDYLADRDFASRYNISSSTLVLARFRGADEEGFVRLDEVWTRARNRDSFLEYVRGEIAAQLKLLEGPR